MFTIRLKRYGGTQELVISCEQYRKVTIENSTMLGVYTSMGTYGTEYLISDENVDCDIIYSSCYIYNQAGIVIDHILPGGK